MRIGVVTSSFPMAPQDTTNAGVFVRDLATELMVLGHEVHVITPQKYGPVHPDGDLKIHPIRWWGGERDLASLSTRNPLTALRLATLVCSGLWDVWREARTQKLDVLLAMWVIPSGLFAWFASLRLGIPYGVWALGSDIWARRKYPLGDRIVRRVLQDAAFRFADGLQLAADARALAEGDCEFVPSARRLAIETAQPVALARDVPQVLYIGRYERNKGPDVLVEAMRLLLDGGTRAHLHLFGVGSLESLLRRRIRGYEDAIELHGIADPVAACAYLKACDWLIIPSRVESIPLIFSDALSLRIPILASAVGDLGELVARYGVGHTVPPERPQDLADAMRRALAEPRQCYQDALGKAAADFDLHRSALRCQSALLAALDGRR